MFSRLIITTSLLFISVISYANQGLIDAVKNKDYSKVKNLIQNNPGIDINYQDSNGATALMYSCEGSYFGKIAQFILFQNPDLNAQDNRGNTILFYVDNKINPNNYIKKIQTLVDFGADINIQNIDGRSIIFYHRNTYILEELLKMGANVHLLDKDLNNPLLYRVSKHNQFHNRDIFLKAKLNFNQQNKYGLSLLHFLVKDFKVARKYYDQNKRYFSNIVLENIVFLINNEASPNLKNIKGHTPFTYAVKDFSKHDLLLIKYFVNNGADIFVLDNNQRDILFNHVISKKSGKNTNYKFEIFTFLHSLGFNINHQDKYGDTVLMHITKYECVLGNYYNSNVLKYILALNVDFSLQNNNGETLLDIATQWKGHGNCNILYEDIKRASKNFKN